MKKVLIVLVCILQIYLLQTPAFADSGDANNSLTIKASDDCIVAENGSKEISVEAKYDKPLTYKWEVSIDNGESWIPLNDANNLPTYNAKQIEEEDNIAISPNSEDSHIMYIYRVTVTASDGKTATDDIKLLFTDKYTYQTLTDSKYEVSVSRYLDNDSYLSVHSTSEGTIEPLRKIIATDCVPICCKEINIISYGDLDMDCSKKTEMKFYVGDIFNGKKLRVIYQNRNEIKTTEGLVTDGILKFIADDDGIFIVEAPKNMTHSVTVTCGGNVVSFSRETTYVGRGSHMNVEFFPSIIETITVNGAEVAIEDGNYFIQSVDADMTISAHYEAKHDYENERQNQLVEKAEQWMIAYCIWIMIEVVIH